MHFSPDEFAGPDPLWRDVLNNHQTRPFHVMIGGGDQIYNDAVMSQSPLFRDWLEIKNPHHKQQAEFTPLLREQLETFYLERYSMWFSQGLFGMANSQIPMINMWDDHGKSVQPSYCLLLRSVDTHHPVCLQKSSTALLRIASQISLMDLVPTHIIS